jgi:translation initiation factor 1
MPFTIDGQWVPSRPIPQNSGKPVKVRLMKRGNKVVTVVLNLNKPAKELEALAASIKKKLGCGGAVKEDTLEFQGDKVAAIEQILKENKKPS